MDVMFTTHPEDGPGKYYMVVASEEEWRDIIHAVTYMARNDVSEKMVAELHGWGI